MPVYTTQEGACIDVSPDALKLLLDLDAQIKATESRALDLKLQRMALLRKLTGKKDHD